MLSNQQTGGMTQPLLFDFLSSDRRQDLIRQLAECEAGKPLNEIAAAMAYRLADDGTASDHTEQRKRHYVSLYQCHIPRLESFDVIEFDTETGCVETDDTDRFTALESAMTVLEHAAAHDDSEFTTTMVSDLLANEGRLSLLKIVDEASEPLSLETLAERIAAHETNRPATEVEATHRKRVYVSIYQTHVPRLRSTGLIEYEKQTGTVAAGPQMEPAAQIIYSTTGV